MVERLLANVRRFGPLEGADEAALTAVARLRPFEAGQHLLRAGDVCDRLWFVGQGLLRVYFLAENQERTCRFLREDSWYTDFESFRTKGLSRENLQALEAVQVWEFRRPDLERLYQERPALERVGRLLTEEALVGIHRRNQMLTLETPQLRYERLRQEEPLLLQRVPLYALASYLNIRPETLSRIRRRGS